MTRRQDTNSRHTALHLVKDEAYYKSGVILPNTSNRSKRGLLPAPRFIVNRYTRGYNDRKDIMIKRYKHTQAGYVMIVTLAAAMVAIGIIMANAGIHWVAIAVLVVLAVILLLFHSLTVVISGEELVVQFGSGVIRRRFRLNEIASCQAIRIPWYYGWGIRHTPEGTVFRVSGFGAVRIKLVTGKEYLIGTDVPQELEEAIRQATSYHL
jgi:hypothetical protein